ncbi:cupin domain-containing protein [Candidatus Sumerlaeota bacterium]
MHKIDFSSQAWETPASGARLKVHQEAGTRLRLLELASDFVEADWCVKGHIGYVLDGRLAVDFNGTVETFEPGDGLFIPPGEKHKHKARALTATTTLILVEGFTEQGNAPDASGQ